jgi:hypothetical protein
LGEKTWSKELVPINGPEALRKATRGSDLETVQLKPGKLGGLIKHFGIGDLEISLGRFTRTYCPTTCTCNRRQSGITTAQIKPNGTEGPLPHLG